MTSFSARRVRADIPLLTRIVNGRTITYLDSGASSLQPRAVIDAMSRYYELRHANVHRGVYHTANEATEAYEGGRATTREAPSLAVWSRHHAGGRHILCWVCAHFRGVDDGCIVSRACRISRVPVVGRRSAKVGWASLLTQATAAELD